MFKSACNPVSCFSVTVVSSAQHCVWEKQHRFEVPTDRRSPYQQQPALPACTAANDSGSHVFLSRVKPEIQQYLCIFSSFSLLTITLKWLSVQNMLISDCLVLWSEKYFLKLLTIWVFLMIQVGKEIIEAWIESEKINWNLACDKERYGLGMIIFIAILAFSLVKKLDQNEFLCWFKLV